MAEPPAGDVLVSGGDREPGERWRRVPPRLRAALLALLVLAAASLAFVLTRPEPVPPPPLGTLGPASARVDDGGTLVRVEAELRTREPVVLRSGTIVGTELVLLLDPVLTPAAGAPQAVTSRIVGLVEPGCTDPAAVDRPSGAELQVVIAPQAGGEPLTLRSDVLALARARAGACAPVQASAALPPGSGRVAEQLAVTVRLVDPSVPVAVLGVSGRGLRVALETTPFAEQVARAAGVRPVVTATAPVLVTDCSVEVLAQRRLTLEVRRGAERLSVQVDPGPGVVAALDELVRRTCRRPRI